MEKDRLDLNALTCLVEIVKRGNLSAAALALHQSPSALSKKISALEERFGERLFQRTGRGLVPTDFANQILPLANALLASEGDLVAMARERRGNISGQVRVGIVTPFAHLAADLHNAISASHPHVRLVLAEGLSAVLEADLAAGRLDVAVVMVHVEEGGTLAQRHEVIGASPLYLAVRRKPGVAVPETVEFRELDGLPLALPEETGHMRQALMMAARQCNVNLNVVVEANCSRVLVELVARGRVNTLVSMHSVNGMTSSADVVLRRVISPEVCRYVVLRLSDNRPATRATKKVCTVLRKLLEVQLENDGSKLGKAQLRGGSGAKVPRSRTTS